MAEDAGGAETWLEVRAGGRRLARYAEADLEAARLGAWIAANQAGEAVELVRVGPGVESGEALIARARPDRPR